MELSARQLARKLGGTAAGDAEAVISGISDLENASGTDASFILSEKYIEAAERSKARVIISDSRSDLKGKTIIKVDDAKKAYVEVLRMFYTRPRPQPGISETAVIGKDVKIGKDVHIGGAAVIRDGCSIGDMAVVSDGVCVGENAAIGNKTIIYPNAVIYARVKIGVDCIIHAGAVIGPDGFGFLPVKDDVVKIPQTGWVEIGNNVEIGANCCIDRGAFGPTVIDDNVKMDNLIHVGHNVKIGAGTLIAAQTGIAGSTVIGKGCIIGGQAGIADHVAIKDGAIIGSKAGVSKDIEPGSVMSGTPARPIMQVRRAEANTAKIPELIKEIRKIKEELDGFKKNK
ncbi:MAG: UDP-3-O-(3-hydroxymyristoyl)glucosamine N-acyltransferase [Candidatus Goldiibacteriota bacterium]